MIEFQNVSYKHQNEVGVNDLSFTIQENEFAFLIGPTGSGKTTLMRLMYFDLLPQTGMVTVGDFSSKKMKSKKIAFARRDIGMVFQDYHLLEDRNLFDNIALPLHVLGFPASEIIQRVDECIDLVQLSGKEKHYPYQLSGGEQQRACLARAIVKDPSLLIADEPTGNLDPVSAFELVKLLKDIHETGTTILMASHNYNLIKGRGYRIMELQDGHLRGGS
ncbi:MAG: ATP-binding cassette domain-containing protein [Candidatus Marinimicrobia bacterium]|jgi:cell division transport system ATP-binding protein|nr:ATP-binding cassette domain-containing protein [Candidatus Neomarinimicrobiota bacterium]MBT3496068.1 ATP-binding cassette domain-containing protein [Candidatus Neomarinimicrobiota bacterium]MBT3692502.1 ATP-binding cassette domain-containing protein [Candidatus Neomarinimicrobiota bacterium]MBT3732983.1 ATP-binding cassette domain-containing protein [Candidatus Neomarinimicrobiota bacterium]MBT4144085.1 ATP-binding cassette domain-containing protein [Candidatus Neomarinimicrobiota bacterium